VSARSHPTFTTSEKKYEFLTSKSEMSKKLKCGKTSMKIPRAKMQEGINLCKKNINDFFGYRLNT
jgi:hypothetical protein